MVGAQPGVKASGWTGALGEDVPAVDGSAWIAPGAIVVGAVTLGPESSVWYGAVLRADDDEILVGARCNVQDLCCLHVDPGEPVVLEDGVSLGHGANVHGAYVEHGALIGIGAIVLARARIGSGSLIAAGSVVPPATVIPTGVLAVGAPCRVVRELTDAEKANVAGTAERYVRRAVRHRHATWTGAD